MVGKSLQGSYLKAKAFGHSHGLQTIEVPQEHDKFVSAEARKNVGWPSRRLYSCTDAANHLVAGKMPEIVINRLELIDIEQQERGVGFTTVKGT